MKHYIVQKQLERLALAAGRAALVVYAIAALLQVTGGVVA